VLKSNGLDDRPGIEPALMLALRSSQMIQGIRLRAAKPAAIPDRAFSGRVAVALTVPLYRRHPTVGIHQFSPVNRGSCSEQSITSRRMFFQRSPVIGTKQRLGRQNACSGPPGNSFGADEFGDGHAIVIRHSSLPLRGRRGACGRIGVRERQNE
jgi:hypothetical protein